MLYVLMGVAAWLIWRGAERIDTRTRLSSRAALRLWGWQLLVNSMWAPAFFGLHSIALGLIVILGMLTLVLATTRSFARLDPVAGMLLVPYVLWVSYATWLNAGFWWLNQP